MNNENNKNDYSFLLKPWFIFCVGVFLWGIFGDLGDLLSELSRHTDGLLGVFYSILNLAFIFIAIGVILVSFAIVADILGWVIDLFKTKKVSAPSKQKIENSVDIYTKVPSSVHYEELLQQTKTLDTQSAPITIERESIPTPSPIKQSITTASNFSVDEQNVSTEDEKERLPIPRKVDWNSVQKARKQTGDFGEMLVVEYEKAVLLKSGKSDLSFKVELVASKNLGYDVLSKFPDGSNKYIEVKAFTGSKAHNFVVTRNELDFLKENPDSTYVYMVINCDTEPEILMTSARQFFKLKLKPSVFKITL